MQGVYVTSRHSSVVAVKADGPAECLPPGAQWYNKDFPASSRHQKPTRAAKSSNDTATRKLSTEMAVLVSIHCFQKQGYY